MISFWIIVNYNHAKQDSAQSFNIGILIGLATFLYVPSILFLFLFLFLLYQVHTYELKDFVAKLLGFFTPFVLFFAFAYLNDSFDTILSKINLNIHFPITIDNKISTVVYLLSMGVLFAFSLISYYMNLMKYSTISKMKIQMNFLFLILAIFISLFHKEMPNSAILFIIPSFSILIRQTFHVGKEKMNNFTFWTLILFLISFQWFIIR
ncbi:MAG: hypothetical protein UZ11_BCD004001385 [Bacteroidetes bacterium OLB11]|nr:MAG: hypothetical protein UZ11_BCD004001385 [Bacteroidetes bacterium OLB11]